MRLFVAVSLPEAVRRAVGELVDALRPQLPPARWVAPDRLHLTLAFLGEQPEERLAPLVAALAEGCRPVTPFEARLGGAGVFPERGRARVAWVAFVAPDGVVEALAEAVSGACRQAGVPPADRARFHPHVTLARCRGGWSGAARRRWASSVPAGLGGAFPVGEATLFESLLAPGGPRYSRLADLPLEAAA